LFRLDISRERELQAHYDINAANLPKRTVVHRSKQTCRDPFSRMSETHYDVTSLPKRAIYAVNQL
jgi:hypothetical protein